jgi:hypothetical protein
MNIEEIVKHKKHLEGDIEELIDRFQNLVGVDIRDITLATNKMDNIKVWISLKLDKVK